MTVSTADPGRRVARPRILRSSGRGFTLIELMITVAIVGILAMVAYPSYQSYIRKGNRADGTSLLQAASLAQEKYRLGQPTYGTLAQLQAANCNCSGTSERGHYTLAISDITATGYTLTANAATALQQGDTGCTAIKLKVTGGTVEYGTTTTEKKCWGN